MFKTGKIKALRLGKNNFMEGQIEFELGKLDWFPIVNPSGMETLPIKGDRVSILIDENDKGVVLHGLCLENLETTDYEITISNRKDKEKTLVFKDKNKDIKITIYKDGRIETVENVICKQLEITTSPTIIRPIDGVNRTCYGVIINGGLRYLPDMI